MYGALNIRITGVQPVCRDFAPMRHRVRETSVHDISTWLREAIANGDVGGPWEGQPYPQLAWRRVDGVVYEARLSNAEKGWYHGYPIDKTEWPGWLA